MLIPMPIDDPLSMAWLDCNDLGNAERLVRLAKGLLLWVEALGWVAYDGKRWTARDGERMAARLAHDVARHVDAEAKALDDLLEAAKDDAAVAERIGIPVSRTIVEERVEQLRKHAVKSGNAAQTAAMLTQAKTLIAARREEFDTDPLALNVQNGTLRFYREAGPPAADPGGWRVRLDAHEPRDMIMQISGFVYDPDADCPEWRARMLVVQPDRDQRAMLQMLYGYVLTGLISEQKWFIFQGRGGDGKSVTNTVIAGLMGDYYRHAQIETFLEGARKSGSDHSSDLARLQGDIRLVTCDEPGRNATWNGSRLKQVTGGKITCRPLRQEEIEYFARWKLVVEVNPLPAVPTDDDGFWRRVRLVPWTYQFDKDGQAAEPWELIISRLTTEGSGILNWMIAGLLKWLERRRLPDSKMAVEAVDEYRQSASPIGEWIADRCDTSDREAKTPASGLYEDFKAWCERAGIEKMPTQTAFGRALRDRQIRIWKDPRGNRWRKGIKLKPDGIGGALGSAAAAGASDQSGDGGRDRARDFSGGGAWPEDFGGDEL
jgi:putative DNA primase/helicase